MVRPAHSMVFWPNKDKFNERIVKYESMFFYLQGNIWIHDPFFCLLWHLYRSLKQMLNVGLVGMMDAHLKL